jgi:hypothetical protein
MILDIFSFFINNCTNILEDTNLSAQNQQFSQNNAQPSQFQRFQVQPSPQNQQFFQDRSESSRFSGPQVPQGSLFKSLQQDQDSQNLQQNLQQELQSQSSQSGSKSKSSQLGSKSKILGGVLLLGGLSCGYAFKDDILKLLNNNSEDNHTAKEDCDDTEEDCNDTKEDCNV